MTDTLIHPMNTETTSGFSASSGSDNTLVGMFVNISEVSGVLPTLIVQLQHSPNGTDWYNVGGIVNGSSLTIAGLTVVLPSSTQYVADTIRVAWTIGGVNASFTFSVDVVTV